MGLIKTTNLSIKLPKRNKLYRQTYEKVDGLFGVMVLKVNVFADDFGGWFKESLRLDNYGQCLALKEQNIIFKPIQANTSFLAPKTKRFWHIHPSQNEIWTTNGTILLGLIDYRPGSPTYKKKTKIILSSDKQVYIPAGIAHGFINPNTTPVTLNYFTDQYFVASDDTQECRIDPKKLSYDFVKPELM
jgi:dTDP-4-dehydrorhamnose 3,5-epimerase-like enzyme